MPLLAVENGLSGFASSTACGVSRHARFPASSASLGLVPFSEFPQAVAHVLNSPGITPGDSVVSGETATAIAYRPPLPRFPRRNNPHVRYGRRPIRANMLHKARQGDQQRMVLLSLRERKLRHAERDEYSGQINICRSPKRQGVQGWGHAGHYQRSAPVRRLDR